MRNEGKRMGRGRRALLWAALLSAFLFSVSPALAAAGDGRETVASEGTAWLLSAGEAALRAAEENEDAKTTASWVQKIWEDETYSGKRPNSITCRLYRNGEGRPQTVTLRAGNGWEAAIGGLARYDDTGKEIEWIWKEINASDSGYYEQEEPRVEPHTVVIGGTEYTGTRTVLVNRLTVTQLTIEKIWLDDTAKDRPKALTVTLTREDASGEAYAGDEGTRTVTLTAADADGTDADVWRRTVRNLPVREGDVWRIAETVPKGYQAEGEAGSAMTVSGAIAPAELTLTNRREPKPPEGGGGGQGGRRGSPAGPEEEPAEENALPEEIPDVGAPWRTLAILVLSGLALVGVGAALACAGKRTRRAGYGAMALGVALAALAIPHASRYLSESGAAESALESARAELVAILRGSAAPPEPAEQPGAAGPEEISGRPEAQGPETGARTQPGDGWDENSRAQSGDNPDANGRTAGSGITGLEAAPETNAGNEAAVRIAAADQFGAEEPSEADGEAGARVGQVMDREPKEDALTAMEGRTEARSGRTGDDGTGMDAGAAAEQEPKAGGEPEGQNETGATGPAAGQPGPVSTPDPAEEARVKELAQKLSDRALLAVRQALAPARAPAVTAPEGGVEKRAEPEEASRDASGAAGDGEEPAEETTAGIQTEGPENTRLNASAAVNEERNSSDGEPPAARTEEQDNAGPDASANAADERDVSKEADPAAQAGDRELPSRWIGGRWYIGTASAPSLALTWPVQADWRGDCLSVSPGVFFGKPDGDRFILIGHNYPTHFGTIEDLQPEDEVVFRDFGGSEFRYSVLRTDILMPDEMEALINDPAALTLVTCARDGNRRVAVRCERKEE